MDIVHVIPNLGYGGAEKSLCKLVVNNDNILIKHHLILLKENNQLLPSIIDKFENIVQFNITSSNYILTSINMRRKIIEINPDLIHCWMHHASLIVFFATLFSKYKIIWSLRDFIPFTLNFYSYLKNYKKIFFLSLVMSVFSNLKRISLCFVSKSSQISYSYIGLSSKRSYQIDNGIDCLVNQFSKTNKNLFINELNLPKNKTIVGIVTKDSEYKNNEFNYKLIKYTYDISPNYYFIVIGADMNIYKDSNNALYLGNYDDMSKFYSTIDILISSSINEGFPNVILEAIAYGKYCISSDAGDSRRIINKYGVVIQDITEKNYYEEMENYRKMNHSQKKMMQLEAPEYIAKKFKTINFIYEHNQMYKNIVDG